MKKIILIGIVLFLAFTCSQAQTIDSLRFTATPTWQRIQLGNIAWVSGYIVNDGTAAADSVAFKLSLGADTSVTQREKIYYGESLSIGKKEAKNIWWRSLGGTTVPIRLKISF